MADLKTMRTFAEFLDFSRSRPRHGASARPARLFFRAVRALAVHRSTLTYSNFNISATSRRAAAEATMQLSQSASRCGDVSRSHQVGMRPSSSCTLTIESASVRVFRRSSGFFWLFVHDCGSENAMKTHLTLCFRAWNADASHTQILAKLARLQRPRYLTSNVDQIAFNLRRGLCRSYVSPRLCKRASLFVRDALPFNRLMRNFKRHFACYDHKRRNFDRIELWRSPPPEASPRVN